MRTEQAWRDAFGHARQPLSPDGPLQLLPDLPDVPDYGRAKAVQALRELDRAGTPVTFAGVAHAAGISRSWLGGRNTVIYTAALKVGSTLGAARSLPGSDQAAWTDEAAENALLAAAEQNGNIAGHGASAARSAIRPGLRNELRNPRPPPGSTGRRTTSAPAAQPRRLTTASTRHFEVGPDRTFTEAEADESETTLPRHGGQADPSDWRNAIAGTHRDEWSLRPCSGRRGATGLARSAIRTDSTSSSASSSPTLVPQMYSSCR